ncbi:hypothetical protein PV341_24510 [Streptomyces sp. PA03-1a]|nr:hypothetical protein [Streptomyces sp. PA03-1a]
MEQPEEETRRAPDRDPGEEATRESGTPSSDAPDAPDAPDEPDEEERGSEQLKIPPHEKRRGTGLEDF